MAAASSSTVVGATIGKHRIVRLIGGGEASRVFVCRDSDHHSDRVVAVKVLRSRASSVADRLLSESATVTKIQSPHVVQVFDVAVYKNMPTISMELVEGESLAALLEKGPLAAADALELGRSICLGLHAAWTHGVAHGDLRPSNVLLPEEDVRQAKVGDFLLAAPIADAEGVRGAAAYLAPELLHGAAPDAQSDLYALGCLLFECVSGETPFTGSAAAILKAQAGKTAPSLATRIRSPQGLIDLVDRLIEKDRGKRFHAFSEVLAAIARALRSTLMPARKADDALELDPALVDELDVEVPLPARAPKPLPVGPATSAAAPPPKPPPPKPPPPTLADLELDPLAARAFAGVHDEDVEMTRVADASMLLAATLSGATEGAGLGFAKRPHAPKVPAVDLAELEMDPDAAEAFEGVHDEGVEMTRVADVASLAAAAARPRQPAALDMLTKILDGSAPSTRGSTTKRSAADIRGAAVRAPDPAPAATDEHDEKTRVLGGIVPKTASADEVGLLEERLPPRKPKR